MCNHEFLRPRANGDDIADVYDSPAWRDFMGPVTYPITRIGFQYCIDGIPAFAEGSHSVKPGVFCNLSLPPTERFKSQNMLLFLVIPSSIKDPGVKKYYDFIAKYELNDLFTTGIDGVRVKIFSTSMDTPGRSELMGMESCLAYQGCPVCLHTWSAGSLLGQTKCIYDGYRRFLDVNSRARRPRFRHGGNVYQFGYAPHVLCV